MVKLILMPKFDQQCAERIARDTVAKRMLPIKPIVRIAICQDGRVPDGRSLAVKHEMDVFLMLYWNYLNQLDIQVDCYAFSFLGGALPVFFFLYVFCSRRRPPARTRRPLVPPARPARPSRRPDLPNMVRI